MEIKSFSKIDRLSSVVGSMFKFLFAWVLHINFTTIIIIIGLSGWLFGAYMDFTSTAIAFAVVLTTAFIGAIFMAETSKGLGLWLGFCFVISGFIGYYVEGNIQTITTEATNKTYMVNPVLTGNSIEYIGGDEMTKIIKIDDEEILAHYKKFKGSDRFTYVLNTSFSKNIILDYVGIDYVMHTMQWVSLHDSKANKDLFRVK